MERGTQVAYLPSHANGNLSHPDVEYGFVTSVRGSVVFCRYWNKDGTLRTLASSLATPVDHLVEVDTVPDDVVNGWLERLESE